MFVLGIRHHNNFVVLERFGMSAITSHIPTLIIVTVLFSVVGCSGVDPDDVRLTIDSETISADGVKRMPFPSSGLTNDSDGYLYIVGGRFDVELSEFEWELVRTSESSSWETLTTIGVSRFRRLEVLNRPGTSEMYIAQCGVADTGSNDDDTGRLRLARVLPGGGLDDLSDELWRHLSEFALKDMGIWNCDANLAVGPLDAIFIVNRSTIWELTKDQAPKIVITGLLRSVEWPPNCRFGTPEIQVGKSGELLIYSVIPSTCDSDLIPGTAFLLQDGELVAVMSASSNERIDDAAIGPNGVIHFLTIEPDEDRLFKSTYRGYSAGSEVPQTQFLNFANRQADEIRDIAVTDDGRLHLIYGGGNELSDSKYWLLSFPPVIPSD